MTTALVVCNTYPSDEALYRNGFIHRRVVGYRAAGIDATIFRLEPGVEELEDYEFDGVRVYRGDRAALEEFLHATPPFDVHLIHFVNPDMVEPLRQVHPRTPIVIWVHGFEAEAWHRRWFNFISSAAAIENALRRRDAHFSDQTGFLRDLFEEASPLITFVHVSDWFRTHIVEPDVGAPTPRFHVIPNLIDEDLFPHRRKSAEDRLHLLSIRPYASRKYANDMTAEAIRLLSQRPYFDELRFSIHGEGHLFEAITRRLERYENVAVEHGFLRQEEIAGLHARHGVFVSPTRFDSQGVSMGEAACSGLLVLSTAVASVPEYFQDRRNCLLGPPEDPRALADNVELLYYAPDLYLELAEEGARHVRAVAGKAATIEREVALIEEVAR